jgi:hypothetical protein
MLAGHELAIAPVLSIKQDKELAVTPNACLRSSMRSTTATIEVRGHRALLQELKNTFEGVGVANGAMVEVVLSLHYADNQMPVQMVRRHQYADQLNCIPHNGGHKDAATTFESGRIVLQTRTPEHTLEECRVHLPRFASVRDVAHLDGPNCVLHFQVRYATNVTSKGHQNRRFFWRASVEVTQGEAVTRISSDSHPFFYKVKFDALSNQLAAAIKQPAAEPVLSEALCDGRPGDLLIITGNHLAANGLTCRMTFDSGKQITLPRIGSRSGSSNSFTTRLPSDMVLRPARICVLGDGVASNELALGPSVPLLPLLHQQTTIAVRLMAPAPAALPLESGSKALAQQKRQQARSQRKAKPYAARPTEQQPTNSTSLCSQGAGMLSRNCSWDAEMWNFALSLGDGTDTLSPRSAVLPFSRTASEELLSWGLVNIA